jgi:hypothetical protein
VRRRLGQLISRFLQFGIPDVILKKNSNPEGVMTRRQFRKDKMKRQLDCKAPSVELDKPVEADPDKVAEAFSEWRLSFLRQFSWHQSFKQLAA